MPEKLKVFHGLVNYGTQAGMLAKEQRNQGIKTISVTQYDPFKRVTNVELCYGGPLVIKIFKYIWNYIRKIYWFINYNTFHFYYGNSLFPNQIDLPFYKPLGKKVIQHYLGKDVKLYGPSVKKYKITNMKYSSEAEGEALRKDEIKKKRLENESKFTDIQFVCSPILKEFVPGSIFIPLAIDLTKYQYVPKSILSEPIKIIHAPTDRKNKGTEFIINAINKLQEEGYEIDFEIIEGVKHHELMEEYKKCDLFIDQVLAGFGTASIEAMAIGRPTISYIRDNQLYEYEYGEKVPVINANKDTIYEVLKKQLNNKENLFVIGKMGRNFLEKHHDVKTVAKKLINIYQNKVWKQ